jgi:hypothetical protein
MSRSTTRSIGRGLAALATLLILVVGVPMWLVHVSGSPLPGSFPDLGEVWGTLTSRDDGTLLLGLLKYGAWAGWTLFVASVLADLVARLRGIQAPRLGPQQRLATQLVGAVLTLAVAVPGTATASISPVGSPAASTRVSAPREQVAAPPHRGVDWRASLAQASTRSQTRPAEPVSGRVTFTRYTVRRGDCLWDIAWNELGDPERWPELYDASRHLRQPDGRRITDPDHVEPGWTVLVPRAVPRRPSEHAGDRGSRSAHTPVATPLNLTPATRSPESEVRTPLNVQSMGGPAAPAPHSVTPEPWEASVAGLHAQTSADRGWRARIRADPASR